MADFSLWTLVADLDFEQWWPFFYFGQSWPILYFGH